MASGTEISRATPNPLAAMAVPGRTSVRQPGRLSPTYELWTGRRESWLPELPVAHRWRLGVPGQIGLLGVSSTGRVEVIGVGGVGVRHLRHCACSRGGRS